MVSRKQSSLISYNRGEREYVQGRGGGEIWLASILSTVQHSRGTPHGFKNRKHIAGDQWSLGPSAPQGIFGKVGDISDG